MKTKRIKFRQEYAAPNGWSRWIMPKMDEYYLACCDCCSTHKMQFRVTDAGVVYRVRSMKAMTRDMRKREGIEVKRP